MNRKLVFASLLSSLVVIAACKPDYPKCDKDEHCKPGEFCVNGRCAQCRTAQDCPAGQECEGGACVKPEGYCETSADCPNREACKANRCVPCRADADCDPGASCKAGRCLLPGQCNTDEDCPENHECRDGQCVGPPGDATAGPCQPAPVYFDFNEFVLTSQATASLQDAAKCIRSVSGRSVRLEGHCDPRGTEEYNLALGDRRARSVLKYLSRLGVAKTQMRPVSKGKLEAVGTDAASWARDRKVLFIWE